MNWGLVHWWLRVRLPRPVRFACFLMLAIMTFAGCSGWKPHLASAPVTPARKEREAAAVRDFEQRRDAAQLQAALDRWQQGDFAGCEARLAALVERRPDDADARLRLAELLASRGDSAAAEDHLRALLAAEPDHPEAHHALGLLLAGSGNTPAARHHLARAAELEPTNEIFARTCDSL